MKAKTPFRPIKFKKPAPTDFYGTVRSRVNEYFEQDNRSQKGDIRMYFKTVALILMLVVPFIFIVIGVEPYWLYLLLWGVTGLGVAGIGFSVMHDANHDAYSTNQKFNRSLGVIISAVGGYDLNWRIQHNILHHSFTNVHGHDEDIIADPMFRFSPHQPWKKRHKYQFIYCWFFYSLMTLFWVTYKDFAQLVRYHHMKLLSSQKMTLKRAMSRLIIHKLLYYGVMLVLPLLFSPYAWWLVVLGFVLMHATIGLMMSLVFQPAHVLPEKEFHTVEEERKLDHSWAEHQLMTTSNYAPKNKLLTWYIGGLNFQIEHHLFPGMCHIHYPAIANIVRNTAEEFQLPYHVQRTFRGAILNHMRMLKRLGKTPQLAA